MISGLAETLITIDAVDAFRVDDVTRDSHTIVNINFAMLAY